MMCSGREVCGRRPVMRKSCPLSGHRGFDWQNERDVAKLHTQIYKSTSTSGECHIPHFLSESGSLNMALKHF